MLEYCVKKYELRFNSNDYIFEYMVADSVQYGSETRQLVKYLSELRYGDLSTDIVKRTKMLFLDWLGSCLAGGTSRQVRLMNQFASEMGPSTGKSEVIPGKNKSSPYFAALVNGASSHVVEQDDLYNAAVLHPATVVFPTSLAVAQDLRSSGSDFIVASVVGYEVGARVGEYLGRSHYKIFHTTGTAGTLGASAAASHLLGADLEESLSSLGSAGTQAAGLWEFLRDGADSKQLHTAKAAANGLMAAYLAHSGFTGARNVVEGEQGLGAGTSTDTNSSRLTEDLGKKWAVMNTSLKYYASCRHTHPSADALDMVIRKNKILPDDIKSIKAHVYQAAIDVLGPVKDPTTVHQSKFSMPFVLSTLVIMGNAGITSFNNETLKDRRIRDFMKKVQMVYDDNIDKQYPKTWNGYVEVTLTNGKVLSGEIRYPKGDPENFLTDQEIFEKFRTLARYSGLITPEMAEKVIDRVMNVENVDHVSDIIE